MQRRSFLHWSAITALSSLTRPIGSRAGGELQADIVIIGGSLGGCAAALAAAKAGRTVILTEETDWIGGPPSWQPVTNEDSLFPEPTPLPSRNA